MKTIKILQKIGIFFFIFSFIVIPIFASAAEDVIVEPKTPKTTSGGGNINIPNPLQGGVKDFMSLVTMILNKIIMPIAAIGVVVFIIYAGFKYVLAQGNPAEITKAHQRLLWGLIGAGILLGAAGISQVVQTTINQLVK